MARIPNHLQIKRRIPEVSGAINTSGAGAASYAGQGLAQISSAHEKVQQEQKDKLHRTEVSKANTQFVLDSIKEEEAAKKLEDYNNAESVFTQNMDKRLMDIGETITDPDTKERWINENLVRMQNQKLRIRANSEAKHKDASLADLNTAMSDMLDAAKTTGDTQKLSVLKAVSDQRIDSAIENGWLNRVQGSKLKKQFKKELKSAVQEREVFAFADEQIRAGASLSESMKAASKITDPRKRLAAEQRIRNLHGVAMEAKKEEQYNTADSVLKDMQDGLTKEDIPKYKWDAMSSKQRLAIENYEQNRLNDLAKKEKLFQIKQAADYDAQIELYHQAIRDKQITLNDIPASDRAEIKQNDYVALQRTQNSIGGVTEGYDRVAYQTMNNLLAEGKIQDAYDYMIDNPDRLGKKFDYMSNQVREALKDKNKAGAIKTLSTYRQRIARMFDNNELGKKQSSWVNEEFENYYEKFQEDNAGKLPTLDQAKQEISNLYAQTKEPGWLYGTNEVKEKEEFTQNVQRYRGIKQTQTELIAQASKDIGMPAWVVRNQVGQESQFDPNATSYTGVKGLHQITAATAKAYGFDPDRVRSNKKEDAGYQWQAYSAIMKDNINKMGGSIKWGLVAYNAGPANAKLMRAGKMPKPIKRNGKVIKTAKQVRSEAYNYIKKILVKK